jgi:tetratricopeptide (TPR) repeat protein
LVLIVCQIFLFTGPFSGVLPGCPAIAGQEPLVKSYEIENAAYKACDQASRLMDVRSYAAARDILLKSASDDPTSYSSNLHLQLSQCYDGLKDPRKAAAEAELSLKYDPNNRRASYMLAMMYNKTGKYDKAIQLLNELLKVTTDEHFAAQIKNTVKEITIYNNVEQAKKCMSSGRNADARPFLEAAAAMDPSTFSACAHGNLSYVLERTGHPEQAITEGKKALQFDPAGKETMYSIGIAYQDIGKFDDAISWLRRYVTLESDANSKDKANRFIQELADDRSKLDPEANSKPDYLDQLLANDAVNMWPQDKMPLKVYISSGKGVFGYRPLFRPFIIRSLNTWCEVSGKKLSYKIVDDKAAADIQVAWTSDPLNMEESGRVRQKAGLTYVNRDNAQKIKDADVHIRTVNGFDPSKLITDGESASVSMHEIGHALGLGHSTSCSDIMYFGSSSKQTGFPTKRDKATIARLYTDYPTISFTEQKAPIPTGTHIEYLPPPGFLPPVPTNADKLPPPLFMPPPAKSEDEKLQPPLFVPPPIDQAAKPSAKHMAVPLFVPAPLPKKRSDGGVAPPLFVPQPK